MQIKTDTATVTGALKLTAFRSKADELVLGVDGGGTKTQAIITDGRDRVLGEGTAGPSNPLRVGISNAASAIREAIDKACADAAVRRSDIVAAEIGLAGVRSPALRQRMLETLAFLGMGSMAVVTDAEIALYGATGGGPGIVLIAGTGSICCGINVRKQRACSGGWGPMVGDEGSGSWIARRALQAIAQASDGRGPQTALLKAACVYFRAASLDDLPAAIYAPTLKNERIAGFSKHVIEAARDGDDVSRHILVEAGRELGLAAAAVIRKLRLEPERFQAAYVGGIFAAGEAVLDPLRKEIARVAPQAFLAPPLLPPVVAAARMARKQLLPRMSIAV